MKGKGKELARDVLALGSWVFYLIVIVRALIGPFSIFVYQLLIGGIALMFFGLIIKNYSGYLSRAIVLGVFINLFYMNLGFSIFTGLLFIGVIVSSRYLGDGRNKIVKGLAVGIVSVGLGYYLSGFLG